jgi:hypothetical protein
VKKESSLKKAQETQKINIGTPEEAKYINLGIGCTNDEVKRYTILFQELKYVFSWNYDYLKEYDKTIFQHTIPLKEGQLYMHFTSLFRKMLSSTRPK